MRVKTRKLPERRENACERALIGFNIAFDWLRGWRNFLGQSLSKVKQNQTGFFRL